MQKVSIKRYHFLCLKSVTYLSDFISVFVLIWISFREMINFSPITWSCHPQMNLVRSEYDRLSTFFRQSNAKPVIIPIILKSRIHVPPIIQFSIRHTPFFINLIPTYIEILPKMCQKRCLVRI